MHRLLIIGATFLLTVGMAWTPAAQSNVTQAQGETQRYIVKFQGRSVAAALGPMVREASHRRTSSGRAVLDLQSEPALNYRSKLNSDQDRWMQAIEGTLGRSVPVVHRFDVVLNGVAIDLTPEEAAQVADLSFVDFVDEERIEVIQTFAGPAWVGADTIWDGSATPGGIGNHGEGLIAGIIDTGVNLNEHDSFVAMDQDGYLHVNPLGSGNFLGACDPDNAGQFEPGLTCTDKVIGAWRFTGPTANDTNQHGSHTASTVAGNIVLGPVSGPAGEQPVPVLSGVAPRANIISYKGCDGGCPGAATSAGLQQAVIDGANAANYSIGPTFGGQGQNPWTVGNTVTMLDMVAAGLFVAASAGNTRTEAPNPYAHVGNKAPWIMTVANSSHGGLISNAVSVTSPEPVPEQFIEIPGREGSGPAFQSDITGPIRFAEDVDPANADGCNPWSGTPFAGAIALIPRGECTFAIKVDNATDAGALGVVIHNNQGDGTIVMGGLDTTTIPSVMIGQSIGEELGAFAAATPANQGLIDSEKQLQFSSALGNILSAGSRTGPNRDFDVTQPDITAPGTAILAAVAGMNSPYNFLSGTSMSSPHVAGAGLLMMNERPDWTVTEIKSAIMMTADPGGTKPDGSAPVDPDDVGAGTVDLTRAALLGLVMHETYENFLAANYATGGNPRALNLPHMRHSSCNPGCSWTRTVRSTLEDSSSWTASVGGDSFDVAVSPDAFELLPGDIVFRGGFDTTDEPVSAYQQLEITVTNNTAGNQTRFGDLILSEAGGQSPDARMHIAVSQELPPPPD